MAVNYSCDKCKKTMNEWDKRTLSFGPVHYLYLNRVGDDVSFNVSVTHIDLCLECKGKCEEVIKEWVKNV